MPLLYLDIDGHAPLMRRDYKKQKNRNVVMRTNELQLHVSISIQIHDIQNFTVQLYVRVRVDYFCE